MPVDISNQDDCEADTDDGEHHREPPEGGYRSSILLNSGFVMGLGGSGHAVPQIGGRDGLLLTACSEV